VDILHPRATFVVVAGVFLIGRVWPNLGERAFAVRKHLNWALLVATVLAALSLVTRGSHAQHERGILQERVVLVSREAARSAEYERRHAASQWLLREIESASPDQLRVYHAFLMAVGGAGSSPRALEREAARLRERWSTGSAPLDAADARAEVGSEGSSPWSRALAALRDPGPPSPSRADVAVAMQGSERMRSLAVQSEGRALDALRRALADVQPSVEPMLWPFVRALTDAAAVSFVPRALHAGSTWSGPELSRELAAALQALNDSVIATTEPGVQRGDTSRPRLWHSRLRPR
jgi:hypothetical protein